MLKKRFFFGAVNYVVSSTVSSPRRFCILPYLAVEGVDPSKRLLIAANEVVSPSLMGS